MNPPRPALARLNWYWPIQLVGWHVVILANLKFEHDAIPRSYVATCWLFGISAMLLSDGWHRVLKRRPQWIAPRPSWGHVVPGLLLLTVMQTAAATLAFAIFQPFGLMRDLTWLPGALLFWFTLFLLWTVFYMAVISLRLANQFEAEAMRLEIHAKDAELRALQAQVNPHFYFNSLNSVRALIYEDHDAAAQLIDQLASLMRYTLQSGQAETVPLAQELEAVNAYLTIEKIRFEERIRVSLHIEPGLELVRIPPMSLQTLVENAVKYGVEQSPNGSDIRISARRHGNMIAIEIANVGTIVPFSNSTRIGLHNARKRLQLSLGVQASLDLSEHSGWVKATLTLPEAA